MCEIAMTMSEMSDSTGTTTKNTPSPYTMSETTLFTTLKNADNNNRKKSKVAQQGHKVTQCCNKTRFWVPC